MGVMIIHRRVYHAIIPAPPFQLTQILDDGILWRFTRFLMNA